MQQIWLAGMGAVARAQKEGPAAFQDAVARGLQAADPLALDCRADDPRRLRGRAGHRAVALRLGARPGHRDLGQPRGAVPEPRAQGHAAARRAEPRRDPPAHPARGGAERDREGTRGQEQRRAGEVRARRRARARNARRGPH
ncbi:MAG: phasin family protein [Desulfobacterales bacterium]|nr:phasin family protein [Desulfobacterales bacterium]